jgi:hypothetical protein
MSLGQSVAAPICVGRGFVTEFWPVEVGALASGSACGVYGSSACAVVCSCLFDGALAVLACPAGSTTAPAGRREWRISAI